MLQTHSPRREIAAFACMLINGRDFQDGLGDGGDRKNNGERATMDTAGAMVIGSAITMVLFRTLLAWLRVQAVRDKIRKHHRPKLSTLQRAQAALSRLPTNVRVGLMLAAAGAVVGIVPLLLDLQGPKGTFCWTVAKGCLIGSVVRSVRGMGLMLRRPANVQRQQEEAAPAAEAAGTKAKVG